MVEATNSAAIITSKVELKRAITLKRENELITLEREKNEPVTLERDLRIKIDRESFAVVSEIWRRRASAIYRKRSEEDSALNAYTLPTISPFDLHVYILMFDQRWRLFILVWK